MAERSRTLLLVALVALALVQLAHLLDVMRYSHDAEFPSVLVDRQALIGIVAAIVAFLAVLTRAPRARELAMLAGGGVAVGFTLYHGIPFDLGVNNPYWGPDGNADLIRWLTVLAAIALGLSTVWLAFRAGDRRVVAARG